MNNEVPRQFIKAVLLLGALLLGSPAHAADYSLDFGVDTSSGKDAGSLDCLFEKTCSAEIESLGLRITLFAFRRSPERVTVRLERRDFTCCYFAYAADKVVIDPRRPVTPVPFFRGGSARGGLHIENERAGTLYLRFSSR